MKANNVFSVLYRTRVKVQKDDTPILNLSLIFSIIAVCSAPWLAVIGLVVALVLGYRFSIERNAAEFSGSFQDVVNSAAATSRARSIPSPARKTKAKKRKTKKNNTQLMEHVLRHCRRMFFGYQKPNQADRPLFCSQKSY